MAEPTHVAIVTGAAQGIGYAIAIRLAKDGLDVAVNDLPAKSDRVNEVVEEIRQLGRKAIAAPGDVGIEDVVKNMVEETVKALGGLDVMVANAGVAALAPFLETTVEMMNHVVSTNIYGTMHCYKYAALQMIKQGRGGRLIGASSSAGVAGVQNISAYSATKFAIRGLTQTAAIELRQHNITANAYAPGIIHTPLGNLADGTWDGGVRAIELFGFAKDTPVAEPEVVASVVSYLSKPEAYFITGQTVSIDGGLRMS